MFLFLPLWMQNTQLQQVLQKLTKDDQKKFSEFLSSPYFNKKKTLIDFWEAVKKSEPAFEIGKTEKENIFKKVFHKPFNSAYYRNICSDLLACVLQYLGIKAFESNKFSVAENLVNISFEYDLLDIVEKQLKSSEKMLYNVESNYSEKLKHRIWYSDKNITLKIRQSRKKHEEITKYMYDNNSHLVVMDYALIKCFINLGNKFKASQYSPDVFNLEEAKKYFFIYENQMNTNDLFVRAYYLLAKLVFTNDVQSYFTLKEILLSPDPPFASKDIENVIISTLSYVSQRVERGEEFWLHEIHELYDFRFKQNMWSLYGSIAYTSFHNAVFIALLLGKISYAEDLIKTYAFRIHEDIRKHVTELCSAWIEFYKGNFEMAHQFLLGIETENILIKYELRTLQSMIYFEMKEYITLLSYIDSFKHFIAYNSRVLEPAVAESRSKFCNFVSQLTKIQLNPNKKDKQKLRTDIEANAFVLKGWLISHL